MILLVFSTLSYCGFSQKIKINKEVDKFTGKNRVETSLVTLLQGPLVVSKIGVKLRAYDTLYYLHFLGTLAAGVISEKDETVFLLDDKSTITIYPTSFQSYDIEEDGSKFYNQQYYITKQQLLLLSKTKVISIRRNYEEFYTDFDIKNKFSGNFINLVNDFLQIIN